MNARRSPRSVVGHHAQDEVSQFPANASSTRMSSVPREPIPVHFESGPMPANDCLRLHQNQCSLPFGPEAAPGLPKTTYQRWKSEAAGVSPSKRQVVAARPDSPRANRDESKRTGQTIRTEASAGAAWSQFDTERQAKPATLLSD